jgi:hypothetical protein
MYGAVGKLVEAFTILATWKHKNKNMLSYFQLNLIVRLQLCSEQKSVALYHVIHTGGDSVRGHLPQIAKQFHDFMPLASFRVSAGTHHLRTCLYAL